MQLNEDNIRRLIMEKILGTIAPEENATLANLIDSNENIKLLYEQIEIQMKNVVLPDTDSKWNEFKYARKIYKRKKTLRLTLKTAAVIAVFLLCGKLILLEIHKNNTTPKSEFTVQTASIDKRLQIHLANGKNIILSGNNTVFINGINLSNDSSKRMLRYRSSTNNNQDAGLNTLYVPPGTDYKIVLSDGTEVILNSESQITFPFNFTGKTREISINGEAYFTVAHNPDNPFIIHLQNSTVRVLGTQFNVNSYDKNAVKVSLVKGSLKFSAAKDSVLLIPGKSALLNNIGITEKNLNPDDLAWTKGEYILNNTSIGQIAELIPRWFGVKVELDNPIIKQKKFSGIIYKNNPLSDLLDLLKGTTDADYYYSNNVLHLK